MLVTREATIYVDDEEDNTRTLKTHKRVDGSWELTTRNTVTNSISTITISYSDMKEFIGNIQDNL